jgi:hypothetical protein
MSRRIAWRERLENLILYSAPVALAVMLVLIAYGYIQLPEERPDYRHITTRDYAQGVAR